MVEKLLKWIAPDTSLGYTHTRVEFSTNADDLGTGTYNEFTVTNNSSYTADGLPIASTLIVDLVGSSAYWYRIRFYNLTDNKYSEYSTPMKGADFRGYCTIEDVRNFTNVQTGEYSDSALQMLIDVVTQSIDLATGRTWQGVVQVTDQYLDGDGTDTLFLPHGDIASVDALAIDQSGTGTFTTVTPGYAYPYSEMGMVYLDRTNAEVKKFSNGRRRVKISYKYGNADPTNAVRRLALLMVANMMKLDNTRLSIINMMTRQLKRYSMDSTPAR